MPSWFKWQTDVTLPPSAVALAPAALLLDPMACILPTMHLLIESLASSPDAQDDVAQKNLMK
eukprot:CAMPEP_0115831996 /NCGR_PEP_ID=MMETSP0287-20121206/2425_1 /TAXON_ID=412157 /ORGANISM="Chrysochromulina rotalis, Strain UIO044" /LENGTH=61 /DNA_ID=CAMNT_0003285357 /DNA_START=1 /DNA_END=183 /DNA_ORIENTATION=+